MQRYFRQINQIPDQGLLQGPLAGPVSLLRLPAQYPARGSEPATLPIWKFVFTLVGTMLRLCRRPPGSSSRRWTNNKRLDCPVNAATNWKQSEASDFASNSSNAPSVTLVRALGMITACLLAGSAMGAQEWFPLAPDSLLGPQEWVRPSSESLLGAGGVIRPSVATAQAIAQRGSLFGLDAPAPSLDYNVKLGPIAFKFSDGLQIQFNDNITLSDVKREADIILSPQFNLAGTWAITKFNGLSIQLGIGYSFYLVHPENNSPSTALQIDPNISNLSFNVKIGDVYLNFHERPSLQQSAANELTLRNPGQALSFSRLSNVIGMSAFWDLNRLAVSAGIDRYDVYPFQSEFKYLQQSGEIFSASVSGRINEMITGGVQSSLSLVQYNQQIQNNSANFQAGPFADIVLTHFLRLGLSGGYQAASFSSSGSNGDSSNLNSYYANISINNNLNAYISQVLSVGREAQLGTNSNYVEVFYVTHQATWRIFNKLSLGTNVFFQNGKESGGIAPQDFNQYGLGFTIGYSLAKRLGSSLQYSFIRRTASGQDSPTSGPLDYYQNLVTLNFSYAF